MSLLCLSFVTFFLPFSLSLSPALFYIFLIVFLPFSPFGSISLSIPASFSFSITRSTSKLTSIPSPPLSSPSFPLQFPSSPPYPSPFSFPSPTPPLSPLPSPHPRNKRNCFVRLSDVNKRRVITCLNACHLDFGNGYQARLASLLRLNYFLLRWIFFPDVFVHEKKIFVLFRQSKQRRREEEE